MSENQENEKLQIEIGIRHTLLTQESILPREYMRRNHLFYPFVCYINFIICLYISASYHEIPIFMKRAYDYCIRQNLAEKNSVYIDQVMQYMSLMTRFVLAKDNIDENIKNLIPDTLISGKTDKFI